MTDSVNDREACRRVREIKPVDTAEGRTRVSPRRDCIVLYFIVLCCIVLYCIVLYCIVLYCIVLYCIVLYHVELCHIVSFIISSYTRNIQKKKRKILGKSSILSYFGP